MNILLVSNDSLIQTTIKDLFQSFKDGYTLSYANDVQLINKYLADVEWLDFILLDSESLNLFVEETNFQEDFLLNYPILLLLSGQQDFDISFLQKIGIWGICSLDMMPNLLVQTELVYHNFQITQDIRYYALRDSLTHLHNRSVFITTLKQSWHLFCRYKTTFCLGMIDIDNFKSINDRFGHLEGDDVLQQLAAIMQKNTRKTDTVARVGGDEFAVIFPETSLEMSYKVMDRMFEEVQNSVDTKVTLSGGLAVIDNRYKSYRDFMKEVDRLLYHSKKNGRNQISK